MTMDINMDKPLKIAIISHALVQEVSQRRWKLLAEDKDYEVHLLVPEYWESCWFGEKIVYEPKEVHNKNFHVHPLPTTNVSNWGKYLFKSFDALFREIQPDLIYIIHEESVRIHHQIYLYRKLFAPQAKVIFFSMNASGMLYQKQKNPFKKIALQLMWQSVKKNTDAALVHYPGCVDSLRSGKYNKPIYIQTQIGVDEKLFAPNPEIGWEYREKINFGDKFVIGYTGRLVVDKGVDDLVAVFFDLAREYENIALLLVGNGNLKEKIERNAADLNLQDRVHITGFVDPAEVPNYMNAMDVFALCSKTMSNWIDTFPLVTVQAQSVGVPVVASDSASLPWQLGDTAKTFQEGNRNELSNVLTEFIENEYSRKEYAKKGQRRSHEYFCHKGMTENFKKIIEQVMCEKYLYHNKDEGYIQYKCY